MVNHTLKHVQKVFEESICATRATLAQESDTIVAIAEQLIYALKAGNKILLCGNGGSAADAQHVAGELVGRFATERRALPAMALTTDTSILTAIGNDYGFENIFVRQVEALAQPGDILVGLSTSGNSLNVLRALETARVMGISTIGFTGSQGGRLKDLVDLCFHVSSDNTARIQEVHITAWHAICELIERGIAGK